MSDPAHPVVDSKQPSDCADSVPVDAKAGAAKPEPAKENKQGGKKGGKKEGGGGGKDKKPSASAALGPLPSWIEDRLKVWDEYKKKREEELKSKHPCNTLTHALSQIDFSVDIKFKCILV
jgi:hypothetical protein